MKSIFIKLLFLICLPFSTFGQAQQYQVGVPVDDTLYTLSPYSQSVSCVYDVVINPNIFNVSGVELYLVIDTIVDPSGPVSVNPGGVVSIGDTLLLPSANVGGGYEFNFTGGSGAYASCRLMARGTPTVAGEQYKCDNYVVLLSGATCQNYMNLMGVDTCTVLGGLSVENTVSEEAQVFPNPSSNKITVTFADPNNFQLRNINIYSIQGKLMYSKKCNESDVTIDINSFANGLYTVLIEQEGRTISKARFLKK